MVQFRYTHAVPDTASNLHLFKTLNGTARADARGPRIDDDFGGKVFLEGAVCEPLGVAFAAAIRLANSSDTEIVISGDRLLWNPAWGALIE
ncbi:MAG TPA: hypothetical protein VGN60_01360 [Devosia sp.]|jgi:hypothetical protein|nr:hypothetical protein [Devosia sp.]